MTPSSRRITSRLRADVDLYAVAGGHVLRVQDTHHHVHLAPADAEALLDALADGGEPSSAPAGAALSELVAAGLVDAPPAHLSVAGDGVLADALRAALTRMGARLDAEGAPVRAQDDDALTDLPDGLPEGLPVCWIAGHRVVLSPPAVPASQVAARHLAATRHRDTDPRTSPAPGRRGVTGALSAAGLELAAAHVAAELLRPQRPAHEAVVIDLRSLTVSRHPVLPVPVAPR